MPDTSTTDAWPRAVLRIPGWIRIVRPANLVLIFAGCVVGSILAGGAVVFAGSRFFCTYTAAISITLIAGFGNILNDVLDISVDQINRPARPIPSGQVPVSVARKMAALFLLTALGAAWLVSPFHLLVACMLACFLILYNWKLKRVTVIGNVVVSLLVASAIAFGALADSPADSFGVFVKSHVLLAMGFAITLTLARELIKDISDMEGDSRHGYRTLPVRLGIHGSLTIIRLLIISVLILCPIPYLFWGFPAIYLFTLLPVMTLLVCMLVRLNDARAKLEQASSYLKWAMAFGLAALGTSAIWPI